MFKNNKFMFLSIVGSLVFAVGFLVVVPAFAQVATYTQLNGSTTLKVGSRGADVSTLQSFMASGKDIYPSGLVTGYFGALTKNAVIQLQLAYDLVADGIAGLNTRNKVNSVIAIGQGMDVSAPIVYNLTVSPSGRNEYFTFTSNELVKTTIFYDVNPISWTDSNYAYGVPSISGTVHVS